MELLEIKQFVETKLKKKLPSHIFLDNMRVIDEDSRNSFAYNDFTYVPFYYWLGQTLECKNLVEIGFRLGFLSGNFLKSCKTVEKFLAVQEVRKDEYYSLRLGHANVRDNYRRKLHVHVGSINDDAFQARLQSVEFDLAIINEEASYDKHRAYFDMLWQQMAPGGVIVAEYLKKHKPARIAYKDFCTSINKEPVVVSTTYGLGLIRKV